MTSSRKAVTWNARITKWVTAFGMAATPFIFATRLYQHGLETVPVYVNGLLAGHANNLVVTLCFCAIWLLISYGLFRAADRLVENSDKASN